MTAAQRQQRHRGKLRNAVPASDPVLAFLTGRPDAVAASILARIDAGMARDIAMALQRRLWQAGSRPDWKPPTRATTGAHPGWMRG
jgi:hypothetical protein